MPDLTNPEDKLFKAVMSRPHLAREVLEARAPADVLATLKLDTLRLTDASYVDEKLAEHFADIVFVCDNQAEEPVEIPFILEHKSYVPSNPPFQIMRYQMQGWQKQINQPKKKPTPIIPVMFYHGEEDWEIRPWGTYLKGMSPAYEKYTPPGNCIFISLRGMKDEDVERFRSGFLKTALLLMKHRLQRQYLLDNLTGVVTFAEEDPGVPLEVLLDNLRIIVRYLEALTVLSWEEITQRIKVLPKTSKAMTVLEEVAQESIEKGVEIGVEKVVRNFMTLNPTFPDEQISEMLGLPLERVKKIRSTLNPPNGQQPS